MKIKTPLTDMFALRVPVIMAPMFLVSNDAMIQEAICSGILGVIPSLNYRSTEQLRSSIRSFFHMRSQVDNPGTFGINLIVQKTNIHLEAHLKICVEEKVPFIITSLGSPEVVIQKVHSYGGKVFCDIINMDHARKCAKHGCDGFIAVGQGAGGHAGPHPLSVLIPALKREFPNVPVIAAGGIADGSGLISMLSLGACGVSCGTLFIASEEAGVGQDYKDAVVESGMDNIMMTERLSGTPCSVIQTPFAKRIGSRQNVLERILSRNRWTKKYFKMLIQFRGMRRLEKAVRPGNYNNLWCAGKSSELIDRILTVKQIVSKLEEEAFKAIHNLNKHFS